MRANILRKLQLGGSKCLDYVVTPPIQAVAQALWDILYIYVSVVTITMEKFDILREIFEVRMKL